jgi:hypothetical protein
MTSTMSAAQLVIMAVVIVAGMAVWLSLVFLADREPHRPRHEPGVISAGGPASAGLREDTALMPPPTRRELRRPEPTSTGPGDEDKGERVPQTTGSMAR